MLSDQEIKSLSSFLNVDIKALNLSNDQFQGHVNVYLENIAGLEFLSQNQIQKLIQRIIENANQGFK